MEQIISQEEFDELMRIKGEIRGVSIKSDLEFILKERGSEDLNKIEKTITNFGYPIAYKEIQILNFYPLGLDAIIMLLAKRMLDFENKDFQKMGRYEAKLSLIMRLFMRYFYSIDRFAKEISSIWRKYFTVGDIKIIEFSKEKKYVILRIENFLCHPLFCQSLIGYFPVVLGMIVKGSVDCEETKCVYRGDEYHEFLMKW